MHGGWGVMQVLMKVPGALDMAKEDDSEEKTRSNVLCLVNVRTWFETCIS